MSNTNDELVFQVQWRDLATDEWKHYYSSSDRAEVLAMYARHVSEYSKERCRMVRSTVSTELYSYIPVNQWEEES